MAQVIGVVGGSGGVGASSFAAALAAGGPPAVLIDLDVAGGGVDVLLGIESAPGARWSGVHLAGGHLEVAALLEALPRWGATAVLAADVELLDPAAVLQVLEALGGATAVRTVVLDLPRGQCAERAAALLCCDLVVVLARGDIAGLVAAHAVAGALPELPIALVVRRGAVRPADAAPLVGVPLIGTLPALGTTPAALDPARVPRVVARVVAGVLAGLRLPVPA